jgi:hypothetical protein
LCCCPPERRRGRRGSRRLSRLPGVTSYRVTETRTALMFFLLLYLIAKIRERDRVSGGKWRCSDFGQ